MSLKIIFMGTPDFAVQILDTIFKSNHEILEVYTQPPKKKNRGQKILMSAVHKFSYQNNLKVRCPEILDTDEEISNFIKLKPDIVVVVAYGKILPSRFLDLKNILFLNVHASLLPKLRGAAPIHRAIMNLEKETGVSIMKIVTKLDAGPVMMKKKINIYKDTNYISLSNQMAKIGSKMILESFVLLENKKEKFIAQNEKEATYANKISKLETKIDWNEKAEKIVAKINALHPNPGSWFELNGMRIKPTKAVEINLKGIPGEILNQNFTVACKVNSIQILELQKEGKQKMTTEEFIKGNKLQVGMNINV